MAAATKSMTRLASVLEARDVSPRLVPLAAFPPSLEPLVRPFAGTNGVLEVPAVERNEILWRHRVPVWFHRVPSKPACAWKRFDGTPLPRYPELIVRDLLVQRGGWNAAWAKNFGGRAFWTDLDRSGPVLAALSRHARDLIEQVDNASLDIFRRRWGPQALRPTRRLLGCVRVAPGTEVPVSREQGSERGFQGQPAAMAGVCSRRRCPSGVLRRRSPRCAAADLTV